MSVDLDGLLGTGPVIPAGPLPAGAYVTVEIHVDWVVVDPVTGRKRVEAVTYTDLTPREWVTELKIGREFEGVEPAAVRRRVRMVWYPTAPAPWAGAVLHTAWEQLYDTQG